MCTALITELATIEPADCRVILIEVCSLLDVDINEVKSKCRKRNLTDIRKVYCSIARQETNQSLENIGKAINKDHATVMHAIVSAKYIAEVKTLISEFYAKRNKI